MPHAIDWTVVWAVILAFGILTYVIMDGFDLGIGILFPTFTDGPIRDRAINAVAPVWDGNETWLVLGGAGLMAAFPLGYAIILPATYPLVIAMLLGLVFRGVSFEFRWRSRGHRSLWDYGFCLGSIVATLSQGILLGAVLQGIKVDGRAYAGGWLDWLTPFSLLTGVALACGYAMLGSCWLIAKTTGETQDMARRRAFLFGVLTMIGLAAVSAATPFLSIEYWRRWFMTPGLLFTAQVPLATTICAFLYFWSLHRRREIMPFLMGLLLFALAFAGLAISVWPYVVPRAVTIWDAAPPRSSQIFLLSGTAVILPIILIYTGWAYWVFRGKVHGGYH